jgi:competence protein ComEC
VSREPAASGDAATVSGEPGALSDDRARASGEPEASSGELAAASDDRADGPGEAGRVSGESGAVSPEPADATGGLGRRAGWLAERIAAAVAEVRARPHHLAVAGLVVGLAAGQRAPAVVLSAPVVLLAVVRHPPAVLLATAAILAGALLGQARLTALDRTTLSPLFGHATSARAILLEAPRRRAFGGRAAVVSLRRERVMVRTSRRVRWPAVGVGAEIRVRGGLERLGPNDGWLRPRNVHAVLKAESIRATGRRRGGLSGTVDAIRERAEHALERGLPEPQAALLLGMALGEDEALGESTREEFRSAGLSHLVAASGQNVMLLVALVFGVAALAGVGLGARLVGVLALIALYVPLAGAGPSIQRAGIMGAAGVVATLAGRPAARWHALLLAAAVTLLLNPRAIEEPGWQLSFAAVAAIMLLGRRVAEALRRRGVPPALAEAFALTAAATLGTAPLIALEFGRTSLVSLPGNVLAAPAVAPVMWLGMGAAALGQFSAAAAAPLAALAGYPLAYLIWLAHAAAGLPAAEVAAPPALVAAVCAALAAAATSRRARRLAPAMLAAALLAAVAVPALGSRATIGPPTGWRVTFLDVGQGDATLLQERTNAVLVDTGPPDGDIVERLRRAGVERLDVLVVTHAQADHDGGAAAVLAALPVGLVLDGRDGVREPWGARMAAAALRERIAQAAPDAGEVIRAGAIELRILSPPREPPSAHAGEDPNQRAIVAEARLDGVRILLTADAESDVLSGLDLQPVDVLKVSHHGSVDPGLPALLERLRPRVAGIEVGAHNTYGHPAPETLAALRTAGVAVYRTDRDGSIRIEGDHGRMRVTPGA